MSGTRPDHPRRPAPIVGAAPQRPGWPEIIAGLAGLAAAGVLLVFIPADRLGPVAFGLVVAAWSGVAGLFGFAVAAVLRVRSLAAFNVRRTTWRWMLIGAAWGVAALLLKGGLILAITALTGYEENPQGMYYDAAGGGLPAFLLTVLFLAVLTPIGEEFLFRGVVTTALLRYGPVIGALGGSVVFAVFHGVNIILPAAFLVGLIAAEVMRRSGSIWPAVAVHAVNNAALPLLVLLTGATAPA
ncbi:CPBP family intramembrane glutamic endopeptidase [Nocardiopsis sp. CC223A]|uniref:CPBP family intramembrane glutamic endopeptidase n=1 Tax=Nocardiopsis sp. CC223A TaxID=3044051 RepID=UPI00278C4E36|nr:CPBP family intramembrane glutamic endopeptidase [Nocardiopsis sp. CC223A]